MCFFLNILWFFWTLPVLLQRWFSTCLVCVHTLTPKEYRVQNIFKNSEKTQYLMNTLYLNKDMWSEYCMERSSIICTTFYISWAYIRSIDIFTLTLISCTRAGKENKKGNIIFPFRCLSVEIDIRLLWRYLLCISTINFIMYCLEWATIINQGYEHNKD